MINESTTQNEPPIAPTSKSSFRKKWLGLVGLSLLLLISGIIVLTKLQLQKQKVSQPQSPQTVQPPAARVIDFGTPTPDSVKVIQTSSVILPYQLFITHESELLGFINSLGTLPQLCKDVTPNSTRTCKTLLLTFSSQPIAKPVYSYTGNGIVIATSMTENATQYTMTVSVTPKDTFEKMPMKPSVEVQRAVLMTVGYYLVRNSNDEVKKQVAATLSTQVRQFTNNPNRFYIFIGSKERPKY